MKDWMPSNLFSSTPEREAVLEQRRKRFEKRLAHTRPVTRTHLRAVMLIMALITGALLYLWPAPPLPVPPESPFIPWNLDPFLDQDQPLPSPKKATLPAIECRISMASPPDLKSMEKEAYEALLHRNWARAHDLYTKLLSYHPGHLGFLYHQGITLHHLGKPQEAWECYASVLKKSPHAEAPRQAMASLLETYPMMTQSRSSALKENVP